MCIRDRVCIETRQEYLNFENSFIHHFHIDHNAPYLPLKFCITIVFYFSWDDCNTQEKLETMVMQIFSGEYKVHYGLCENNEYQHEQAY